MLAQALGRRPADKSIAPWREVADTLGVPGDDRARRAQAAAKRIKRLCAKPDGPSLRLYRSGVHRGDFTRWLEASGRPSTSDVIRNALSGGKGRRS